MRHGRLTLLCDDYDMLDADARELVDTALQAWSETPYDHCQLVIACDSDIFERDLDGPGQLMALPVERLKPLSHSDMAHMLATSPSGKRRRGAAEEYASVALARPVSAMLTVPAVARALADGFRRDIRPHGVIAGSCASNSSQARQVNRRSILRIVWGRRARYGACLGGAGRLTANRSGVLHAARSSAHDG